MTNDHERLLKQIIAGLSDSWLGVGQLAWVVAGGVFLVFLFVSFLVLRWIYGGGLSRTRFGRLY